MKSPTIFTTLYKTPYLQIPTVTTGVRITPPFWSPIRLLMGIFRPWQLSSTICAMKASFLVTTRKLKGWRAERLMVLIFGRIKTGPAKVCWTLSHFCLIFKGVADVEMREIRIQFFFSCPFTPSHSIQHFKTYLLWLTTWLTYDLAKQTFSGNIPLMLDHETVFNYRLKKTQRFLMFAMVFFLYSCH